jgi:hypothetical protein
MLGIPNIEKILSSNGITGIVVKVSTTGYRIWSIHPLQPLCTVLLDMVHKNPYLVLSIQYPVVLTYVKVQTLFSG